MEQDATATPMGMAENNQKLRGVGNMVDLHTHILPGIDDGARDLKDSEALLKAQYNGGVRRNFLTPHFYPEQKTLEVFLEDRARAYEELMSIWDPETMPEVKLGAEVRYSPELVQLDLSGLTLGGSRYLLLELSTRRFPTHLEQVIQNLVMLGYTPILAHLERYPYFLDDPNRIATYVNHGAMGQVNAEAFLDKRTSSYASACFKHSLAHIIASDTHDLTLRPPMLQQLDSLVNEKERAVSGRFSEMVWNDEYPPILNPTRVNKLLGRYF